MQQRYQNEIDLLFQSRCAHSKRLRCFVQGQMEMRLKKWFIQYNWMQFLLSTLKDHSGFRLPDPWNDCAFVALHCCMGHGCAFFGFVLSTNHTVPTELHRFKKKKTILGQRFGAKGLKLAQFKTPLKPRVF